MRNGSEHTPEHPTGTDYKALIEEGREWADGCADGGLKGNKREMDMANMFTLLADAVESLLGIEQRLTDHIVQLAAARDALQARLDAMTVEEQHHYIPPRSKGGGVRPGGCLVKEQRLVSEWTVVEGDQS